MPITEALKKLIKTITGKNAVGETIEELVTNLNDNYPEGGGGGESYETVAEIEVGTMDEQGGLYIAEDIVANVPLGETLYFNNPEYEMEYNATMTSYLYNFSAETQQPTGTPAYVLAIHSTRVTIGSDTDLSNTTVKILKKVSGGSSGSGVKMIHATAIPPEQEGGDITLDIVESDEECRAMVTSGEPVVIEVMAPVAELGTSLPVYGLMTTWFAPTENRWNATFCIVLGYNRTSIQAFVVTLSSPADGKRGMVIERNYDLSPKVVKVDFVVDYVNKTLISASHTPAEVVELVENGTWVYGYDSARGLYELRQMKKEGTATRVGFDNQFGDDCTIDTDENGSWEFNAK